MNDKVAKLKMEIKDFARDIRMLEARVVAVKVMKEQAEEELSRYLDKVIEFTEKDIA